MADKGVAYCFTRVHQSHTHHLVMSLQILDGSRRLRHLRHHPVHPVIGSIVNVQQMDSKFAGIHQLPVQLTLMLFQVGQPRTAIFADVHVHLYRFGVYRQIGNEVVSNSNISQSIFHCDPLSPLRVVVWHQRDHIGNIAVQRFANLDQGLHGDMFSLTHVGNVIRCQMRQEPQILFCQVLVNQCFPQWFIADFHSHSHLSRPEPITGDPSNMVYQSSFRPYQENIIKYSYYSYKTSHHAACWFFT